MSPAPWKVSASWEPRVGPLSIWVAGPSALMTVGVAVLDRAVVLLVDDVAVGAVTTELGRAVDRAFDGTERDETVADRDETLVVAGCSAVAAVETVLADGCPAADGDERKALVQPAMPAAAAASPAPSTARRESPIRILSGYPDYYLDSSNEL